MTGRTATRPCERGVVGLQTVYLRPAGAAKDTMKVAHVLTEADIIHRATSKFKELAEQKSGGELTVQIYPTSALAACG